MPWKNQTNAIEFGGIPDPKQLLNLTNQIKTFNEGTVKSSEEIESIRWYMQKSHKYIFLGFAFHEMNMELLLPSNARPKTNLERYVFASTFDISDADAQFITKDLLGRMHGGSRVKINIKGGFKCSELFVQHARAMSLV